MAEVQKVEWSALGGDFITVLAHALLMRCGGQQAFTHKEIAEVTETYIGIRMAWSPETEELHLTLRSREIEDATSKPEEKGE